MKATGIVRKIDELGRITIPVETRRALGLEEKDSVEFFVDGENIVLKKYQPSCIFCSSMEDITEFKGKKVCAKCRKELK